jgi:phosphatidylinositol phospholipase C delta
MIALTDDVYSLWVDTLSKLVCETSDRMVGHVTPSDPDMAWIRQLWPAGAKSIDWSVAVGLCRSIGLAVPQEKDLAEVCLQHALQN